MNNIFINNNDIDGLQFGSSSVSKVYFGDTLVYEDVAFPNLCYDVTNDISTYTATTFEDVFDTSSDKWYKLNNLDQYEEYGLYEDVSSLSDATYYNGKLVVYNNHEYEYSNGWNDLGEPTQVPVLPSEYTELDYVLFSGTPLVISDLYAKSTLVSHLKFYYTSPKGAALYGSQGATDTADYRFFKSSAGTSYLDVMDSRLSGNWFSNSTVYEVEIGNNYIKHTSGATVIASGTPRTFDYSGIAEYKMTLGNTDQGRIYHLKVWDKSKLVKDMYPCYRNADDALGMYDIVSDTFYAGSDASGSVTSTTVTQYPKEYTEKYDPSNNLTFTSMTEANSYDGCVYVGMTAYIDGAKYILSENHEWIPNYLRLKAVSGDATVGMSFTDDYRPNLSYSADGTRTWTTWDFSNITIPQDKTIYFKGNNPVSGISYCYNSSTSTTNPSWTYVRNSFTMSGYVESSGSIMSLVHGDNVSNTTIPNGAKGYGGVFCAVFADCTGLTTAPELPATSVNQGAYKNLFSGCISLTKAPELPATTLGFDCYNNMFLGADLKECPILPATTLVEACYRGMFARNINLIAAPYLPAETLVKDCYRDMFASCSNLNFIKAKFTTTPSTTYTSGWVSDVASSGTYVKNSAASYTTRGIYAIPSNWTIKSETM